MAGPLHSERLGSGPRVVLVHGFTQTGRCWGRVADDLAGDHEVVAIDAPGHGGSSEARVGLWEGAELLGQAGGRAVYVGYSMGARLCLHLALARPELVEALVLIGATPGIEDPDERAARRADDEALAHRIEEEGVANMLDEWLSGPLFARLPPEAACREERERNTPEGLASSLRLAGTGSQEPLWRRLPELSMPVLVVAGAEDAKFATIAEQMTRVIPDSTLALVPGAGHPVPLEAPGALIEVLRSWAPDR